MRTKTIAVITVAIAVLVASVATPRSKVHLLLDGGSGTVLWNPGRKSELYHLDIKAGASQGLAAMI